MTKEYQLSKTALVFKDYLQKQFNDSRESQNRRVVLILEKTFPIDLDGISMNQSEQEKSFLRACKALDYDGYIKDHCGIVFQYPLGEATEKAIVENTNTTKKGIKSLDLLLTISSLIMSIIAIISVFVIRDFFVKTMVSTLTILSGNFLIRSALAKLNDNNAEINESFLSKINNYYQKVSKLRQEVLPNISEITMSYDDRKNKRNSNHKQVEIPTVSKSHTIISNTDYQTATISSTSDDNFWRDMFFADQISDAIQSNNIHEDHHDWNDNDWSNDNLDDDHYDDWNDNDYDDWGSGGGSDWGGGDDFGGSDW